MNERQKKALIDAARHAAKVAYVPYSDFPVGAALLTVDGDIYTGCNVENASYGLTMCAERNAVYRSIVEGNRHFKAIAIVGGIEPLLPCGACRQVLAEFSPMMTIISCDLKGTLCMEMTLSELFPNPFSLEAARNI